MKADEEKQKSELREQEIAKRIVSLLDENAFNLDNTIASKLTYAREEALAKMMKPTSKAVISQNGVLRFFGDYWYQHRLLMMLLMLGFGLAMFLTIKNIPNQNELESESGDAYLLASEVPPEAFLNEGFGTWLSENTQ